MYREERPNLIGLVATSLLISFLAAPTSAAPIGYPYPAGSNGNPAWPSIPDPRPMIPDPRQPVPDPLHSWSTPTSSYTILPPSSDWMDLTSTQADHFRRRVSTMAWPKWSLHCSTSQSGRVASIHDLQPRPRPPFTDLHTSLRGGRTVQPLRYRCVDND